MCGRICIQPYASPGKALIIFLRRINNLLKLRLFTEWISNRETPIFLCLVLNKSLYYFSKNPLVTHYILTSKWYGRFARKKPFMINMQDEVLLSHHVSCLKEGSNPVFYILFNLHLNKCRTSYERHLCGKPSLKAAIEWKDLSKGNELK